ncbi:SET and MYND domain-containing protein 4-like [Penaeus chinensis]|uniref:SET and MYND domain-containing protein 4-like n=1 Tax=Penaeus chinensis TaxID=139456 RepID=UPI001FB58F0E|nr:SET and MYND domain-containing protein 4-like [Penaeus chinensis]
MIDILKNFMGQWTLNDMEVLKTAYGGHFRERDMFNHMWRMPAAHEYLSPPLVAPMKSEVEADRLRNEGNVNFMKKRLDYSMQLFNESICAAPHPPLRKEDGFCEVAKEGETPVNHSLMKDEKTPEQPEPAEIEPIVLPATGESGSDQSPLAEEKGIPREQQKERLKEMASDNTENPKSQATEPYLALARGYGNRSAVLFHCGRYHESIRDMERALRYSQEESFKKKLLARKVQCLEAIQEGSVREVVKKPSIPPKLESCNPAHPSLSKCVRVENSSAKGRHLVAERDIRPGELLMVEEGHWDTLSADYRSTHCAFCFSFCLAPVPCPSCRLVIFCGEDCRARALAEFHARECPVLPSLMALDLDPPVLLAARIVLKTSYATLKEVMPRLLREMDEEKRGGGGGEEGVFDPSDFRNLILCDSRKMKPKPEHYLVYCTSSLMLTKLLEESGRFFVDRDDQALQPSQDDLRMTGMTIFLVTMTAFTLSNSIPYLERLHGGASLGVRFSSGIWPTVCLAQKSCCPSVTMYMCGSALVMRSIVPIPAGRGITTLGTFHFSKIPPAERREANAGAGIQCSCVACLEDWPIYQELQTETRLKCPKCSHPLTRSAEGRVQCLHHEVSPAPRGTAAQSSCWAAAARRVSRILGRQQKAEVGEDMDEMKDLYATIDKFVQRRSFLEIGEETDEERRLIIEVTEILDKHGVLPCKLHCDIQDILTGCLATRDRSISV